VSGAAGPAADVTVCSDTVAVVKNVLPVRLRLPKSAVLPAVAAPGDVTAGVSLSMFFLCFCLSYYHCNPALYLLSYALIGIFIDKAFEKSKK
jgi:hypothetical protein